EARRPLSLRPSPEPGRATLVGRRVCRGVPGALGSTAGALGTPAQDDGNGRRCAVANGRRRPLVQHRANRARAEAYRSSTSRGTRTARTSAAESGDGLPGRRRDVDRGGPESLSRTTWHGQCAARAVAQGAGLLSTFPGAERQRRPPPPGNRTRLPAAGGDLPDARTAREWAGGLDGSARH